MPNHLADATSPYLRQHADNPVDWYAWGPEPLARARAEDKPILLSVGYSACHWCHVMAHESFEDPDVAALLNERFVNIKVDREERPDIDDIYQKVVALMGQGGGWPLTVFLLPDQRPFYGGTYFPPDDRYGRPGFARLLETLSRMWIEQRDDVLAQADRFMEGFAELARRIDEDGAGDLSLTEPDAMREAVQRLLGSLDPKWGGLGRAPKFPNVPSLRLLLGAAKADPEGPAAAALALTLEQMWRGGIYDHLRGGFARYSTDREWLIPHFEKMLYDNALLLELYAEASLVFGARAPHLRRVVEQTAEYLLADMRTDRGAFWSATDADSEGVEGKYFCWTPAQLNDALGEMMGRTFARAYGVTDEGNFEHGMSVLHLPHAIPPALELELAPARMKLLELRYARVPPLRDDKVLTAWNALVISGFCKAASAAELFSTASSRPEPGALPGCLWAEPSLAAKWTAAAQACGDELLTTHRDADGRTLRASWQGQGHTRAYLEDVALLARACLDLHERTLTPRWHDEAARLAQEIMQHYAREGGGLFNTADDGEQLIERTESQHDSPLPSGLAATIEVLARLDLGGLGGVSGPDGARELIERTLERFANVSARPLAFAGLIDAARWASERAVHVTIRAATQDAGQALAGVVRRARASLADPVAISFVEVAGKRDADALVCRAQVCSMPITDADELQQQLVNR